MEMSDVLFLKKNFLPTAWAPYSLCRASLMCHQTTWGHLLDGTLRLQVLSLYNGCWDCISSSKVPCLSLSRSLSLPMCHLLLCPCSWAPTSWKLLFVRYFSWERGSESVRRGWECSLALWRCSIRSLWRRRLAELLRERRNDCKSKTERGRKV